MLRNEASIRELFCRLCTAGRSFVPQDDREIGYAVLNSGRRIVGKVFDGVQTDKLFHPRYLDTNNIF
jgi:hypothetical protein